MWTRLPPFRFRSWGACQAGLLFVKQLSESKWIEIILSRARTGGFAIARSISSSYFHHGSAARGSGLPWSPDGFLFFSLQSFACFTRSKLSLSQSKTGELCKELQPLNDQGSLCWMFRPLFVRFRQIYSASGLQVDSWQLHIKWYGSQRSDLSSQLVLTASNYKNQQDVPC